MIFFSHSSQIHILFGNNGYAKLRGGGVVRRCIMVYVKMVNIIINW